MAPAPVSLVEFGARGKGERFRAQIAGIGMQVSLVDGNAWCSDPGSWSGSAILFLASSNAPAQRIRSALRQTPSRSVLAVFASDGSGWDEEIALLSTDFLYWPCGDRELKVRLANAFGCESSIASAGTGLVDEFVTLQILGRSPALQAALRSIRSFAACDAPVLVEGETGTGKELVSRAIHYFSARRNHPFIPITCGAIPDSLLENELFGHERGAFTDARERQAGLVEQGQGGTLFLDEVETLSPRVQAALLRFLETREYRALGGGAQRSADVRIVAATNVALDEMVRKGTFRRDLLYRLNVLNIRLPSLAARREDIQILAEHFVQSFSQRYGKKVRHIDPETIEWMMRYPWPGNVRELQNLLHRELLLATEPVLRIPEAGVARGDVEQRGLEEREGGPRVGFRGAKARAIEAFERSYLRSVMDEVGGNVSEAARRIGKDRRSLGKLLKKHGLTKAPG